MYCKHCGKQIADNSKFCSHCGKPLDENATDYMKSTPSFGDASTKGEWEIKKGIITTSFMWNGDKYYDRYEIIKLNSNDFIFKNVKESNERHFKRVK